MWPIVLICYDPQFKVTVIYKVKSNLFDVQVDCQPYNWLPYIAPNNYYGDAEEELLSATIVVNGQVVLDEAIHWNFFVISEQIKVALGDQNLKTFAVKNLGCKDYVTNELLDLIASQIISDEYKLAEITFSSF